MPLDPPPTMPPPWRRPALSSAELDWLLRSQAWQTHALEVLMATVAELKTAADTLTANEAALATEVQHLASAVTGLEAALEAAKASGGLSGADQATLDAAVQAVTDASTALATQTASLSTLDGGIPAG